VSVLSLPARFLRLYVSGGTRPFSSHAITRSPDLRLEIPMFRLPTRSLAGLALALAAQFGAASRGGAQVLTNGGDSDLFSSNATWTNNPTNSLNQIIFDNFSVGSGLQWTVTGVFGSLANGGYSPLVSVLNWEIRQGMVVSGSTGTVVAAGSGAFAQNGNVHTIAANPFTLNAGTYWLGIWADLSGTTSDDPNNADIFFGAEQTSGANAVNALSDGRAIWLVGADALNAGGTANDVDRDFAYGVLGRSTVNNVVPEPGSVLLMGSGLLALGFVVRRRRGMIAK